MEISGSTFALQIVNFLALLWLLTRFLYRPVRAAVARRQQELDEVRRTAQEALSQGHELQQQYEERLSVWEQEKQEAREQLHRELEAERLRARERQERVLHDREEQDRRLREQELRARKDELERQAIQQSLQFASRLLQRVACPELEARLIELAVEQLDQIELPPADGQPLRISTAFPLDPAARQRLETRARERWGERKIEVSRDPELVAGVRLELGDWRLGASLVDELQAFGAADVPA